MMRRILDYTAEYLSEQRTESGEVEEASRTFVEKEAGLCRGGRNSFISLIREDYLPAP